MQKSTSLKLCAQYVRFHHLRYPAGMGAEDISRFLTHLAVNRTVAAATQNQALNALQTVARPDLIWSSNGNAVPHEQPAGCRSGTEATP